MPRVIALDVNETLLDLHALDPHFERVFGSAAVRRDWFKQVLQSALLTTVFDAYSEFGAVGAAALEMTAAIHRGLHCPICKPYLRALDRKLEEFENRGVHVIAVSTDTKERAARSKEEWELARRPIGYGLEIAKARAWGLFISRGIKEPKPTEFAEPGLFLLRPDGALYAASVQSMPFARPHFSDVLPAIDYINKNDYPPRGEA